MKIKYILWLIVCLSLTLSAMEKLGKETRVDSVLASVNGEPITLLDVMLESSREEMRLANLYTGARLYNEIAKLRKNIVEGIIVRKLVHAQYKKRPFPIDNQYIEDMVDYMAQTIGNGSRENLIRKVKAMGSTMQELREKAKEKIAVDVLMREFCDRPVYVTPKEVYDCYVKNAARWTEPAGCELELLLIARDGGRAGTDPHTACRKIAEQLKGADAQRFQQIVKANSDAENAQSGGKIGLVRMDKLRPEFVKALAGLKPGMIAGPVETPEGYYFIRLVHLQKAKKIPFEQVAQKISADLESRRRTRQRKEYSESLKKQALIRYYF